MANPFLRAPKPTGPNPTQQHSYGTIAGDQNGRRFPGAWTTNRGDIRPISSPLNVRTPISADPNLRSPAENAQLFADQQAARDREARGLPPVAATPALRPSVPWTGPAIVPRDGTPDPKIHTVQQVRGANAFDPGPRPPDNASPAVKAAWAARDKAGAEELARGHDGVSRVDPTPDISPGAGKNAPFRASTPEEIAEFVKSDPNNLNAKANADTIAAAKTGQTVQTPYGTASSRVTQPGEIVAAPTVTANGVSQPTTGNKFTPLSPETMNALVAKYPDLGKAGTPQNKAFVASYKSAQNEGRAFDHETTAANVSGVKPAAPAVRVVPGSGSPGGVPPVVAKAPASPPAAEKVYDPELGESASPDTVGLGKIKKAFTDTFLTQPDASTYDDPAQKLAKEESLLHADNSTGGRDWFSAPNKAKPSGSPDAYAGTTNVDKPTATGLAPVSPPAPNQSLEAARAASANAPSKNTASQQTPPVAPGMTPQREQDQHMVASQQTPPATGLAPTVQPALDAASQVGSAVSAAMGGAPLASGALAPAKPVAMLTGQDDSVNAKYSDEDRTTPAPTGVDPSVAARINQAATAAFRPAPPDAPDRGPSALQQATTPQMTATHMPAPTQMPAAAPMDKTQFAPQMTPTHMADNSFTPAVSNWPKPGSTDMPDTANAGNVGVDDEDDLLKKGLKPSAPSTAPGQSYQSPQRQNYDSIA